MGTKEEQSSLKLLGEDLENIVRIQKKSACMHAPPHTKTLNLE
jgi:hypothetical protein